MVSRVASRASLSKAEAAVAFDGVFEAIQDALATGDSVAATGFGTFSVRSRPAPTGRNPRTGESVEIAASRALSFKAGKTLRDAVRQRSAGAMSKYWRHLRGRSGAEVNRPVPCRRGRTLRPPIQHPGHLDLHGLMEQILVRVSGCQGCAPVRMNRFRFGHGL